MTHVGSGVHVGADVVVSPLNEWTPAELAPTVWLAAGVGLTGSSPVTAWANQGSLGGAFVTGPTGGYILGPDAVADGCDFGLTKYLVSNIPKSSEHYIHDGTGMSGWANVTLRSGAGTHMIMDTNGTSSTTLGLSVLIDQGNQRICLRIGNGSGTVFSVFSAIGSVPHSMDHFVEWYFLEDMGSNHIYRVVVDGVILVEQLVVTANAPGSGDSVYFNTMGGRASSPTQLSFDGVIKAFGLVDRILSASEIAELRFHYTGQVVQTPAATADLRLWLDAYDLGVGTVTTWTDKSGYGNHATAVGSPTVATDWSGGNKPCVTTNGTTQYITADGVASVVSGDDKPFSIAMVYRLKVDAAAYRGLWAFNRASSGTPLAEMYINAAAGATYVRANRDDANSLVGITGGASSTAKQILIGVDTGTTFTSYFNGLKKHDAVNVDRAAKTLDLFTIACTRRGNVPSQFVALQLCEVLIWNRVLTADELAYEQARLNAKWNVSPPAGGLHRWSVDSRVQDTSNITTLVDMIGGEDVVQGTGTKQPLMDATGSPSGGTSVLYDGTDDYLGKAFTLAQPYAVVVVAKCINAAGTLVDGVGVNSGRIYYQGGTFRRYAGVETAQYIAFNTALWHIVSAVFDEANSLLAVDGTTGPTGNSGTIDPNGVTIGAVGGVFSNPANAHILEVVYCTVESRAAWVAYLNAKYGIF
jgi:hypothetical protein